VQLNTLLYRGNNIANLPQFESSKLLDMFKSSPPQMPVQLPEGDTESTAASVATSRSLHSEKHGKYNDFMRDSIIGFADGLTVPFALTAGLSA
jgi:hypothetical protein